MRRADLFIFFMSSANSSGRSADKPRPQLYKIVITNIYRLLVA